VTLRLYASSIKFALIVWVVALVLGFNIAYFLVFHVRGVLWQIGLFLLCTVQFHAIEYQGSYVKVTIERPAGREFVANVVDENFFRDALDIGDRVLARWSARDVLILEGTPDGGEASMSEAAGALL
jgi:TOBE domain